MSKEFKNIDELFKAELGGTTAKAPAHVKANIDKAIGFGGRKMLLWFLIPFLFIGITAPLLYNLIGSESSKQLSMRDSNNSSSSANEHELNESNFSLDFEKNNESSSTQISSDEISDDTILNGSQKSFNSIRSDDDKKNIDQNSNLNSDNTKINDDKKHLASNKIDKRDEKKDKKIIVNDEKMVLLDKDKKVLADDDDKVVSDFDKMNIDSITMADNLLINDNKLAADSIRVLDDKVADNKNPTKDSLNTDDLSSNNTNPVVDSALAQPDVNIDPPSEAYNPWILSATAGINLKRSNLIVPTTGDTMDTFHNINDKIGHSAQIEIAYRLKNSLTFGTGIGYSSFIENYSYFKSENVLTDTTYMWVYTQDSMQDTLGGWVYWQDSTQQESYVYNDQEIYNANGTNINTYLNIPISIGTNLDFGKFRWDLFAQGRFNVLLRSRTTYVENDQIVIAPKGSFKNSYFDLILGTNLHYNIFGNLYVTGTFRYKPPTAKTYYPALTNRFQNVHVGVGFSMIF